MERSKMHGDRLNKILNTKPNDLPTRFAPKRDRSESVDKLFNDSRSRIHSSLELTALNKTRQQQLLNPKKDTFPTERKEELQKKTSIVYPTLGFGERQSTQIFEGSQCVTARPSQLIAEIKKQYTIFKKNVLAELQRQREMVQKMLKQLVLTFQYELEKLTHHQNVIVDSMNLLNTKQDSKIKSIEDWKFKLAPVSLIDSTVTQKAPELKQSVTLNKSIKRPSKQKRQDLSPPKLPLNIDSFLVNLSSLKRQLEDMDKIFAQPEHQMPPKTIKK